jgi:hypothetical protein
MKKMRLCADEIMINTMEKRKEKAKEKDVLLAASRYSLQIEMGMRASG